MSRADSRAHDSRSPRELQPERGLLKELEDYGFELPEGLVFFGDRKVRVATREALGLAEALGGSDAAGLPVGKKAGEFKPSSAFLRVFPARERVVELSRAEAEGFMRGRDFEAEGRGYRVVKSGRLVLGCGFARDGVLESLIPKKERLPNP